MKKREEGRKVLDSRKYWEFSSLGGSREGHMCAYVSSLQKKKKIRYNENKTKTRIKETIGNVEHHFQAKRPKICPIKRMLKREFSFHSLLYLPRHSTHCIDRILIKAFQTIPGKFEFFIIFGSKLLFQRRERRCKRLEPIGSKIF